MQKHCTALMLMFLMILTGCNGSSGENESIGDNGTILTNPSLTTSMQLSGTEVNQFKANQQVQISATLLDVNGEPIDGEIVYFTADIGTLNTASALTSNGIAHVTLSSTDENIGAGVLTASFTPTNSDTITHSLNYQIVSTDSLIDDEVRLGYFDDSDTFIEGKIQLSIDTINEATISAGGTLGLSVDLVDNNNNRTTSPTPVTFTSNCVQNGNAVIDATVFSIKGNAKATFEDIDCAGASGTDDVIIASVTVNGITSTASESIAISGEQLGSIEFISASPTSIVLKGTGGQNKQETSTLTFKVKSALGNVLAQHQVDFILNTSVGGIILSRENALTNSQGLVTTQVTAGSVPTSVRVTAKSAMEVDGETIYVQTQSDLLSINTGLPEQRSLTIGATVLNPEADLYNGETSIISARLADNFNNPVPDGTTVNFTTEGGVIEPTCSTINGHCSVTWTSAEPRVEDHRVTILITALGHESFFDSNGNNTFDDEDGNAITDTRVDSGAGTHYAEASGFIDMSEAWRDDDEDNEYDLGELFFDYDEDGNFSIADGYFNGPQCQGDKCAASTAQAIHVRKSLVLVMAGSSASYILSNASTGTTYQNSSGTDTNISSIGDGSSLTFRFRFADQVTQTLPLGSTVAVSLSAGQLSGSTNYTVTNNNHNGYAEMSFVATNPIGGTFETATLTITITTPKKGEITSIVKTFNLL